MGILDDAIREHLNLKRRQGAGEDELARLEGEAFGPATRPGEPDFPDQQGADEGAGPANGESPATDAPPAEAPPAEAPDAEAPPAEAPHAEAPPAEAEAPPAGPAAPEGGEAVPAPADQTSFYDQREADSELDLELDDEAERADQAPASPVTEERPAPESADVPVESHDTVEHRYEEALAETGEAGLVEEEAEADVVEDTGEAEVVEDTGEAEVVEGEIAEPAAKGDEEDEDVLEETPEFLRDAPEDDELWFEQGEPKDFDF